MSRWLKRQTTANAAQWAYLRAYMADNPKILGKERDAESKKRAEAMWDTLTRALNSLGPPQREQLKWRKVCRYIIINAF